MTNLSPFWYIVEDDRQSRSEAAESSSFGGRRSRRTKNSRGSRLDSDINHGAKDAVNPGIEFTCISTNRAESMNAVLSLAF